MQNTKKLKGKVVLILSGRRQKTIDDLAANADARWRPASNKAQRPFRRRASANSYCNDLTSETGG